MDPRVVRAFVSAIFRALFVDVSLLMLSGTRVMHVTVRSRHFPRWFAAWDFRLACPTAQELYVIEHLQRQLSFEIGSRWLQSLRILRMLHVSCVPKTFLRTVESHVFSIHFWVDRNVYEHASLACGVPVELGGIRAIPLT